MSRELMSCEDCVFCSLIERSYNKFAWICNLGLDDIFHKRNELPEDVGELGCIGINLYVDVPCKGCYTDEEMCKLLGV